MSRSDTGKKPRGNPQDKNGGNIFGSKPFHDNVIPFPANKKPPYKSKQSGCYGEQQFIENKKPLIFKAFSQLRLRIPNERFFLFPISTPLCIYGAYILYNYQFFIYKYSILLAIQAASLRVSTVHELLNELLKEIDQQGQNPRIPCHIKEFVFTLQKEVSVFSYPISIGRLYSIYAYIILL